MGRNSELDAADLLLRRTQNGLTGRSLMLYGLRGVGKTVLLNEMRRRAEAHGWLTAMIEAKQDRQGAEQSRARLARAHCRRPQRAPVARQGHRQGQGGAEHDRVLLDQGRCRAGQW
ncbi:ATP-binding protein [Oerskovia sp. M15]